jgi:hypothetical protein
MSLRSDSALQETVFILGNWKFLFIKFDYDFIKWYINLTGSSFWKEWYIINIIAPKFYIFKKVPLTFKSNDCVKITENVSMRLSKKLT